MRSYRAQREVTLQLRRGRESDRMVHRVSVCMSGLTGEFSRITAKLQFSTDMVRQHYDQASYSSRAEYSMNRQKTIKYLSLRQGDRHYIRDTTRSWSFVHVCGIYLTGLNPLNSLFNNKGGKESCLGNRTAMPWQPPKTLPLRQQYPTYITHNWQM